MKKKLLSLFALIASTVMGAWADTEYLYYTSGSGLNELSSENGVITITDLHNTGGGIQSGGTNKINDLATMKLSANHDFEFTYSNEVTINSVTIYLTGSSNKEITYGAGGDDNSSYGNAPKKGDTPAEKTFAGAELSKIRFSSQCLIAIVVDYTSNGSTGGNDNPNSGEGNQGGNDNPDSGEGNQGGNEEPAKELVSSELRGFILNDGEQIVYQPIGNDFCIMTRNKVISNPKLEFEYHNTYSDNTEDYTRETINLTLQDVVIKPQEDLEFPITAFVGDQSLHLDDVDYRILLFPFSSVQYNEAENTLNKTIWDWSKAGETELKLINNNSIPRKDEELILGNYFSNEDFFGENLTVKGEYLVRDGKFFQGSSVKVATRYPGRYKVTFSNTGNRSNESDRRYLYVNGQKTEYGSMNTTPITTEYIYTDCVDRMVEFTSKMDGDNKDQYIRIYSIEFEPCYQLQVGETGFATLGLPFDYVVPEDCSAYDVRIDVTSGAPVARLEEVSSPNLDQRVATIIMAAPGNYDFVKAPEDAETFCSENQYLIANAFEDRVAKWDGEFYVLATKNKEMFFAPIKEGKMIRKYGACLSNVFPDFNNAPIRIITDEDGISSIITDEMEQKIYDVLGNQQQELNHGLNIVNGQIRFIK